jgi:glyoxylase-like metal-dependent hydrolase (beta-lactamase superfamily II)
MIYFCCSRELTFNVLHCPGHSPGSIAYFNPVQRLAIVGDVLFAGSSAPISPEATTSN